MDLNRCALEGFVVADPTPTTVGTRSLVKFSLACPHPFQSIPAGRVNHLRKFSKLGYSGVYSKSKNHRPSPSTITSEITLTYPAPRTGQSPYPTPLLLTDEASSNLKVRDRFSICSIA